MSAPRALVVSTLSSSWWRHASVYETDCPSSILGEETDAFVLTDSGTSLRSSSSGFESRRRYRSGSRRLDGQGHWILTPGTRVRIPSGTPGPRPPHGPVRCEPPTPRQRGTSLVARNEEGATPSGGPTRARGLCGDGSRVEREPATLEIRVRLSVTAPSTIRAACSLLGVVARAAAILGGGRAS